MSVQWVSTHSPARTHAQGVNTHPKHLPWSYPPFLHITTPSTYHPPAYIHPPSHTHPPSRKDMGPEIPNHPSPVNRMTDRCLWKHYLPLTSFAGGKRVRSHLRSIRRKLFAKNGLYCTKCAHSHLRLRRLKSSIMRRVPIFRDCMDLKDHSMESFNVSSILIWLI